MNEKAFQDICKLFDTNSVNFKIYTHEVCRTSDESAKTRKAAGMPDAIGAKALLCKLEWKSKIYEFATLVLPGTHTLSKAMLKTGLPELKQFRFASQEELLELAGVVPGCMPPFGTQIFPAISKTYISSLLLEHENIAFNAAKLDASIFVKTDDYLKVVIPDAVFKFSEPKDFNPSSSQ